jgi:hypothetical protein
MRANALISPREITVAEDLLDIETIGAWLGCLFDVADRGERIRRTSDPLG